HFSAYTRSLLLPLLFLSFFTATPTSEIYTLSLHDALPIYHGMGVAWSTGGAQECDVLLQFVRGRAVGKGLLDLACISVPGSHGIDRKSTRLNSSHDQISYAVFCLKKKKKKKTRREKKRKQL